MYKQSLNELASEGERLCKSNDCANGIKYFEAALQVFNQQKEEIKNEQEELKLLQTMSIIYNQMGNAYFYLQDYTKALEYHKKDLELSGQFGDESGKAKACGNIGNTLQLLGDFDEAILYSFRNLEISQKLNDSTGEARAFYNLANIYQSKGKHMGRLTYNDSRDPNNCEFANEIKEVLLKAVHYYNETLKLVSSKDRAAEGRTHGNLGNTHYLLGDFESAIECHNQRLKIAKEYGDRAAERRAYSNLGNSHIFQGKFNEATDFYLKAMNVAKMIGDKAIEAQSYYSLGNAYILLQDYSVAIDFHLRHLQIAQLLEDKIGESRAYWSLGNAYASLGDLENAIQYANKHLQIARLIGDSTSELTAKMNLYDFQNLLSNSGVRDSESGLFTPISSKYGRKYLEKPSSIRKSLSIDSFYTHTGVDRIDQSQQHLQSLSQNNKLQKNNDIKLTSQENISESHKSALQSLSNSDIFHSTKTDFKEEDASFFDVLSKIQSNRLDDQRCSIKRLSTNKLQTIKPNLESHSENSNVENEAVEPTKPSESSIVQNDEFFNLIMKSQRSRLEDQRTSMNTSKIHNSMSKKSHTSSSLTETSSSQSYNSKINKTTSLIKNEPNKLPVKPENIRPSVTVPPDDAFFSMIQKIQSRRLDEQRSVIKSSKFSLKTSASGSQMLKKVYDR